LIKLVIRIVVIHTLTLANIAYNIIYSI